MRYALSIGINDYPGTGNDLVGCVNDANDWAEELTKRGYEVETMLDGAATGDAIRDGIRRRLHSAGSGDTVVITYSGHGTWVPDADGDEPDGRDEALCPYDLMTAGPLLDDDLYDLFTDRERGVRVVLISDSCHSGTVTSLAPALSADTQTPQVRFLPPSLFLDAEQAARAARVARVARGRTRHAALLLSGCQDLEYSYDAWFGGRPNGAFTYVALAVLRELPEAATYRDWMTAIRGRLPSQDYPQTPGLRGSSTQKRGGVLA
jgi:hypothetical protein